MTEIFWSEIAKWGVGAIFGGAMMVVMFKVMRWGMLAIERMMGDFRETNQRLLDRQEESDQAWRDVVERNTGALERNTRVLEKVDLALRRANGG